MAGMVYWEKDETKSDDFPVLIQGDSSFLIVKNTTLLIKYVFGCLLEETGEQCINWQNITMLENIHMLHTSKNFVTLH